MQKENILVLGAGGALGSELVRTLIDIYGNGHVIATDEKRSAYNTAGVVFEEVDTRQSDVISRMIKAYSITQIYHLSATRPIEPVMGQDIMVESLLTVLLAAHQYKVQRIFWLNHFPPVQNESTDLDSEELLAISGTQWARSFYEEYGLDVRSIRLPALVSYIPDPDKHIANWIPELFKAAMGGQKYIADMRPSSRQSLIYLPDAARAILLLMHAPPENLSSRLSYDIGSITCTYAEIVLAIREHYPDFKISYKPEPLRSVTDNPHEFVNDEAAKRDFGWQPEYDLDTMTQSLLYHLRADVRGKGEG